MPHESRYTTALETAQRLRQRGMAWLVGLSILGAVFSYVSVNIPHTEVFIDARWLFGFVGFALLRRWWAALLLACILSLTGFHKVPWYTAFVGNMLFALPFLLFIRLIHQRILSRVSHPILYGLGWFLLILIGNQVFTTPAVWGFRAVLKAQPVLPAVVEGWLVQPFLFESLLVGIISALAMTALRVAAELHASRNELAVTLDSIGDAVIATDLQGRLRHMNPVAEELTGWRFAEAEGRAIEEVFRIVDARTRAPAANPVDRTLAEGVVVGLANHTALIAKDGTERAISDSAAPIRTPEGETRGAVLVFRDVSAEYGTREALEQSEKKYRTLFEESLSPVLVANADAVYIDANPAALEFLECSRSELLGKRVWDFSPPARLEQAQREHAPFVGRRVVETEYWVHDRVKTLLLSVSPLELGGETVLFGIGHDITERKAAEAALQENEARFKTLFMDSPVALLIHDRETGEIVDANPKALASNDCTTLDKLRQGEFWLEPPYAFEDAVRLIRRAAREGGLKPYEWCSRRKDGSLFWEEVHLQPVAIGGEERILATTVDITARKQAEQALRDSEQGLRNLLDNIPGIAVQGYYQDGSVFYWNAASERLYGYTREEALASNLLDLIIPEEMGDVVKHALEDMLTTGEPHATGELSLQRKDGSRVSVLSAHAVVRLPGRPPQLYCLDLDLTEREEAEEERMQLEARMQEVQKLESLGILAGGIAHDFNNILMAVLGHADLALAELSPVSPARESIAEIERAARRAGELCKQMLAYSGQGAFVVEPVNVNELVEEMLHLLKTSISKHAVLNVQLAHELPRVEGDASQLRQVLMNLVINASDALEEKSGTISVSTGAMECKQDYLDEVYFDVPLDTGFYVTIEVADTGVGMDAETQARIFDPFFTTKFTGRGLGLAAVQGIVRGHKGALKVYSEKDKGSCFKVLLPAAVGAEEDEAPETMAPGGAEETKLGGRTVLLADDEETLRTLGARMLQHLGCSVLTAEDGREAVRIFEEKDGTIDCVVLDLTMPHMNGEEAFRELRRLSPRVKVILASGYSSEELSKRMGAKGMAGFLQKPYTTAALKKAIQDALA